MTFSTFNSRIKTNTLLEGLSILETKEVVIQLNTFPDYDISQYQGLSGAEYFFRNSWSYANFFIEVSKAKFGRSRIFHHDHISEIANRLKMGFDPFDHVDLLQRANESSAGIFSEHGIDVDELDSFRLKAVRVSSIDNIDHKILYEGVFFGDSSAMDPIGWGLFNLATVTGIKREISQIYQLLIAESYMLFVRGDAKLSFFMAYTALESFLDTALGEGEVKGRLPDKLNSLFSKKFATLNAHQVYSSISGSAINLTRDRNSIAHGRGLVTITLREAEETIRLVLILIGAYEFDAVTFEELFASFNHKPTLA
jgi:hypothetical protein